MRTLEYIVPVEYDNRKVLHFLKGSVGLSSRLIRALKMQENGIMKNGSHTRTVDIIKVGDKITINIPDDSKNENFSVGDSTCLTRAGVEILYEDADVLVVNKPALMPIHQSHNHQGDTLADLVISYLNTESSGAIFRAVGRLDKGTSGIVVCGKNAFSANKLQGNIYKTYFALPSGSYSGTGTIEAPIYRPDPLKTFRNVDERGDYALTRYEALKTGENVSLVRVNIETGRTHQIRVHFAYLGTPLIGDTMYGTEDPRISHQSLHCGIAEFEQPYTGVLIKVEAKIPEDMERIILSELS
ncbi:MAG: RluA family pseudouridine synthase [Oscillospiraceae bacterium]|nr:RluA family pseudouridine synthase [Oscillospiraceae bacterium]